MACSAGGWMKILKGLVSSHEWVQAIFLQRFGSLSNQFIFSEILNPP